MADTLPDNSGSIRVLVSLDGNLEDANVIAMGGSSRDPRVHGLWEIHHAGVINVSSVVSRMIGAVYHYTQYPQTTTAQVQQDIRYDLAKSTPDYLRRCFVEVPNACFIEGMVTGATGSMWFGMRERNSPPSSKLSTFAAEKLQYSVLPTPDVNMVGAEQLTLEDFFTLLLKQSVYQLVPPEPASGLLNIKGKINERRVANGFRSRVEQLEALQDWFKLNVQHITQELTAAPLALKDGLPSAELVQEALRVIAGDLQILEQVLHTGQMPPELQHRVRERLKESGELAGDAAVAAGITDVGEALRGVLKNSGVSVENTSGASVSNRIQKHNQRPR